MTVSRASKHRPTPANLLRCAVALGLATVLGGCNSAESEVQKVVIDNLLVKDVYKFGEYTEINGIGACQTVNSVRADGRETGDMQAFAMKKDGTWHFLNFLPGSHEECVQAGEEMTQDLLDKGYKG
ncbi:MULTISPECIES: hypothetical protein [unclassified Pseudomonas]|uniref:hypothetical protein n=1 Tax=unclassified Pseudomonas TaxID=196821 RepID=UPI000DA9A109|nr:MULTISPECIES: hypothetical protein [unclassified Pseudomonas]MDW3713716.1 hypothetical protein [Pseudomonas sp. 2023EL-01195]PZE14910.1 hypothetical protein DMX10_02980 [Pseudomonas sp. 57B-090624]